jgi:serine protease AprX
MAKRGQAKSSAKRTGAKAKQARKAAKTSAKTTAKTNTKTKTNKEAARKAKAAGGPPRKTASGAPTAKPGVAAPSPRTRAPSASPSRQSVAPKPTAWATPGALTFASGLEPIVRTSDTLSDRVSELSREVTFTVATTTVTGKPIQAQKGLLTPDNLDEFRPAPDQRDAAIETLIAEDCKLIRKGRFTVTMSGSADVVEKLIGSKLVIQARARRSQVRAASMFATDFEPPFVHDLFVTPATSLSVPTKVSKNIDHLVFTPPPLFFAPPSANAPTVSYHHVDEASIRRLLNVPAGYDGTGVKVGLIDTGFYPHPYYSQRGLNIRAMPTASAPDPQVDNYGHGSAVAYNIFATAPKAEVLGFQQTDPPQDALEDAAEAGVDVISCSWGWDREQLFPALQASLLSIINEGKIVLFAAGNGQYAWPGSEPTVISIGGVYWNETGGFEASNYASGYMSGMFQGRRIPDVCGLCGQLPKAIYIMMPTQPSNMMDNENAGNAFPDSDGTAADDGWVGASGTSSATPQIAGVVALMVQKARAAGKVLTPAAAKTALEQSCVAVTTGRNAMGFPASDQPNTAVGFGLVNAAAALKAV